VGQSSLASSWPLESRHDLIRLIFVSLYGRDRKSIYTIKPLDNTVSIHGFQFRDFLIERNQ
jgi:hypothetical protein